MVQPIKINERIQKLTILKNRGAHTTESEVENAFATLGVGNFLDAAVFLGSFDGNAGWERHLKGDELVQIIAGETEFDIITNDVLQTLKLDSGSLMVVPQGCWHRFRSSQGVTVLTATPQKDEEHTFVDDPRNL
tara:strand:+ start:130 stop:531 length:402 start_codon:yes stop_codon:yes gene_type:complete